MGVFAVWVKAWWIVAAAPIVGGVALLTMLFVWSLLDEWRHVRGRCTPPRPWWWRLNKDWRAHARREKTAIPDGTRVTLLCPPSCAERHRGVWVTSWTPRRTGNFDDPDDYRLTRESDGEGVYAEREGFKVLE